jgi:hypothetical protein
MVGRHALTFYVWLGTDSATLGFWVTHIDGGRKYFPMYVSTYRGMPQGVLTAFTSAEDEGIWIASRWPGYEVLGYYRPSTNSCVTRYGVISALDVPMPDVLGGDVQSIPALDRDEARAWATVSIPKMSG